LMPRQTFGQHRRQAERARLLRLREVLGRSTSMQIRFAHY
jgi:hypothetical protein